MKVAAIYDIHGNLPALEAVVEEIRASRVDLIVVGGDVVPGPMPREALEFLLGLEIPTRFIRGNGDRAVAALMAGDEHIDIPAAFRDTIQWNTTQLDAGHQRVMNSWPERTRVEIDGIGTVMFCHATPRNDTDIFTRETPEDRLLPLFGSVDAALVVCGHTHMQFDRRVGDVRVVNAGSVGLPFGEPGAYWLLLGPGVEHRRTPYDLDNAARIIRGTSYPEAEQFAAVNILNPPSEAEILERFGKIPLKDS